MLIKFCPVVNWWFSELMISDLGIHDECHFLLGKACRHKWSYVLLDLNPNERALVVCWQLHHLGSSTPPESNEVTDIVAWISKHNEISDVVWIAWRLLPLHFHFEQVTTMIFLTNYKLSVPGNPTRQVSPWCPGWWRKVQEPELLRWQSGWMGSEIHHRPHIPTVRRESPMKHCSSLQVLQKCLPLINWNIISSYVTCVGELMIVYKYFYALVNKHLLQESSQPDPCRMSCIWIGWLM